MPDCHQHVITGTLIVASGSQEEDNNFNALPIDWLHIFKKTENY